LGKRSPVIVCLFLIAPSPGQALRFVERRGRAAMSNGTPTFFISDTAGQSGRRALFSDAAAGNDLLTNLASDLAQAFGGTAINHGHTVLLRVDEVGRRWDFRVWKHSAVAEQGEREAASANASPWRRFLPGHPVSASQAAYDWAIGRGLPADRTPLAPLRQFRKIPVVDYAVVAQLDQRSLLIEDGPRLYRFVVGGGA